MGAPTTSLRPHLRRAPSGRTLSCHLAAKSDLAPGFLVLPPETLGRRLVAADLHSDNRVAAVLAWHFEAKPARGARRPHLITAAAVRKDLNDLALRSEYLVALWLLMCVAAAIDRKTGQVGRVGLVQDAGIALTAAEIADLGLQRGRMSDGYKGEYYTFGA
jgi:hypothetical protein